MLYYRDSETLCTEMRSLGIKINREDQIITRLEIHHHHMYPHLPALSDSPDRLSTVGDPSCMVMIGQKLSRAAKQLSRDPYAEENDVDK
jgi:hypothetical protein